MTTHNWFAVETRPRAELAALADIQTMGLEAYVPQETRLRRTRRGKVVVQHPLLPGFIFVAAETAGSVRRSEGRHIEAATTVCWRSVVPLLIFAG